MESASTGLPQQPQQPARDQSELTMADVWALFRNQWALILLLPLLVGAVALGVTFLIPPTYTAKTLFLPPQQNQGAAASVLASLGPLAGLAGGAAGIRTSGDQYVALMQSVSVTDRIIDRFDLVKRYESKFREDARKELGEKVRIALGKKDGLISVQVDDHDPQTAADMANRYVEELRQFASTLVVTEAQQRRVFFEQQLLQAKTKLDAAQRELQASGFSPGALKAEPRMAADSYGRLRAEIAAAEIKLQGLRNSLTDLSPEVRQQQSTLGAMREQLAKLEKTTEVAGGPDYISRYRDFKYQEAMVDIYTRQFELAKVDESREGALIQVVDPAIRPEKKSKPKRAAISAAAAVASFLLLMLFLMIKTAAPRRV